MNIPKKCLIIAIATLLFLLCAFVSKKQNIKSVHYLNELNKNADRIGNIARKLRWRLFVL